MAGGPLLFIDHNRDFHYNAPGKNMTRVSQNCMVFAGHNENHALNLINGDDDYDDDLMMIMNFEYILLT